MGREHAESVSAFLGAMGPVMTPFYLAYGLTRGALVGTQALAALVLNGSKLVAYGGYSLMTTQIVVIGLAIGAITIFGAFLGKLALDRVSEHVFPYIVEGALVAAGLWFVFQAG